MGIVIIIFTIVIVVIVIIIIIILHISEILIPQWTPYLQDLIWLICDQILLEGYQIVLYHLL